ncbi:Phospholipase/Carboxylesterase-domain-containing protein [Boletus edulis]|nr:Phospholipase/Carboxylesterase-domain-containing protein [Boletus edulis]
MATRVIPSLKGPYEVVKPSAKHTATVIFLHGLGDSGSGWLAIVKMIKDELPHVKWLLPNAPSRSITANRGFVMPGWFDLLAWDLGNKQEDRDGMLDSARTIDKYIQDEVNAGIPSERIVVGGFSQGGTMALLAGLTARGEDGLFGGKYGWKLGGVAVLSGWMPLSDAFPKVAPTFCQTRGNSDQPSQMVSPHLVTTPILMSHGTADTVVPHSLGQRTSRILTNDLGLPALEDLTLSQRIPPSGYSPGESKLGAPGLSFRSYRSAGHEACEQTLEDLKQFLMRVLLQ